MRKERAKETRPRLPGGGRKPKAITIAKRLLILNKIEEAEKSFAFLVALRDNPDESSSLRQATAIWIYEAINGKAKQPQEQQGEILIRVQYENANSQTTATPYYTSTNKM
jgi:hypothetical protein